MARKRSIKPEFFTDVDLAEVSIEARYLYAGMWPHMDRQGVVEADPRIHRANVFPHDDKVSAKAVQGWIDELVTCGFLRRTVLFGKDLLFCPTFARHQKLYSDERARFNLSAELIESLVNNAVLPAGTDPVPHTSRPGDVKVEVEVEVEVEECAVKLFDLEDIYRAYPKRSGSHRKGEGLKALSRQLKTKQDFEDCLRAAKNYHRHCELQKSIGTNWVQMFKTWCGSVEDPRWREWLEYTAPKTSNPDIVED